MSEVATHQPVPPATRPGRGRRWLWASALLLGLVAAIWGLAQRPHAKPAEPALPDMPRVDGASIVLPKKFAEMAGVRTAPVVRQTITSSVKVLGTATFDPAHVAAVGARARGLVHEVKLFEGDTVETGDVLAVIESSELGQAEADFSTARAQLLAAQQNLERELHLHKDNLTTTREVEIARATLAEQKALLAAARQRRSGLVSKGGHDADLPIGRYTLRAPLMGTIIERHIHDGQSIADNLVAFRVADLRFLWVELQVTDRQLVGLAKGDVVEIRSLAQPGKAIAGRVAHVGDVIDPVTGAAPVRVEIDNAERVLRPGQSVTAVIRPRGALRDAIVVPLSALTWIDGDPTVFVEREPLHLVPTPVTLGASDGHAQEILTGVAVGERVVTEGVFLIKSELYR